MNRPSIDKYWAAHLRLTAERATCVRRKCGSIITDWRGACLSMGYNGIPSGIIHCGEPGSPCSGGGTPGDSGNENTQCWAVHAEVNAILHCHRIDLATTLYCTNFPCFNCAKMIANTPIYRIICLEDYPGDRRGLLLLTEPREDIGERHIRIGDQVLSRAREDALTRLWWERNPNCVEEFGGVRFFKGLTTDSIL